MRVNAPTYFQTPNDLVDHWLPKLGEAEVKILLVVFRKTFGWHKQRDQISLSQFQKLTGLNRTNASRAIQSLVDKGIIIKQITGKFGSEKVYYELVITEDSNNSDQYRNGTPTSTDAVPLPVPERYPQKKLTKDIYTKTTTPTSSKRKVAVVLEKELTEQAKEKLQKMKDILDKHALDWGEHFKIPIETFFQLAEKYGVDYVEQQYIYMGKIHMAFFKSKDSAYNKKKPIEKPEIYLKLACQENFAWTKKKP